MMWRRSLVVVVGMTALFGAGCFRRDTTVPVGTLSVATSTSDLSALVKDAQTYESKMFGYAFSYPRGFHLEELSTEGLPPEKRNAQFLKLMPEEDWATESKAPGIVSAPSVRVYVVPKIGVVSLDDAAAQMRGVSREVFEKLGYTTLRRPNANMIRYITDDVSHVEHLVFEHGEFMYEIAADGKSATDATAQAFDLMGRTMRFE